MTPIDLDLLRDTTPDRGLEGLEGAVWNRVSALEANQRRLTPLASAQALLFVVAVGGSAAFGGVSAGRLAARTSDLGVFSPHAVLAPSSRMLGSLG
ncbi:hypothetical protein QO010_002374 [Caulobacter ginsengisoli]|uniref:Uncharacterized protein n=1 Tax=Caulobacter ginsengisoli TaxID=400775 RepID=A0ABU0IRF1_9CAUL|nr:hypothetical protein [Caulobacter ginsengisoli]MDQ0464590.1 hypothetical protein [Caulobacter ginsengisoli]